MINMVPNAINNINDTNFQQLLLAQKINNNIKQLCGVVNIVFNIVKDCLLIPKDMNQNVKY